MAVATSPAPVARVPGARAAGRVWSFLRRYPVIPVTVLLIVLVIPALFAELIAPHDPIDGNLRARLLPPAWTDGGDWSYPLGSDRQGRDILSRMIFGARTAALVSLAALAVGGIVGSLLGLVAGYFGSWWDHVIMRLVDINLSLPLILLALVLVVLFEPGTATTVAVVALLLWSRYARQVRAEVLSLKEMDFVARARVAGASEPPHHLPPHPPERLQHHHRAGDAPGRKRHPAGGVPELPRSGHPPAGPRVGRHDRGRPRLHRHVVVAFSHTRSRHHAHGALHEPAWRLAPRLPRPPAPTTLRGTAVLFEGGCAQAWRLLAVLPAAPRQRRHLSSC